MLNLRKHRDGLGRRFHHFHLPSLHFHLVFVLYSLLSPVCNLTIAWLCLCSLRSPGFPDHRNIELACHRYSGPSIPHWTLCFHLVICNNYYFVYAGGEEDVKLSTLSRIFNKLLAEWWTHGLEGTSWDKGYYPLYHFKITEFLVDSPGGCDLGLR